MKHLSIFLFVSFFCFLPASNAQEILFVHSEKAQLKAEPLASSADVSALKRGEQVKVLKAQGIWYQIEANGKTGWISKLFVNKNAPIGSANLTQISETSEAKSSRKRSTSYSVSAATRGLMAGDRTKEGREQYRADQESLKKLDKVNVDPNDLKKFQQNGGLIGK